MHQRMRSPERGGSDRSMSGLTACSAILGSVEDVDVRADVTDDCVPLPPDEKFLVLD